MRDLLKPLAVVLAVPVLATALGMLARSSWDARWSASLARQMAAQRLRPDGRVLARYSLALLCTDRRNAAQFAPCRSYNFHSTVIGASAGVGAAGFALLGGLLLAAYLARTSRRRMACMFRPSLIFAAVGTAVVAVLNALLALAALLTGVSYLFGTPIERTSVSLALVGGTIAIVWSIGVVTAAFSVTRRPAITIVGRRLDPSAQRPLVEQVRDLAGAVGASPPVNIVAGLGPWTWVTEAGVATLDGSVSGRTLCVSLPLCRILSLDEFRALVAHELAHFSGDEEDFTRRAAPFYAGALRELERLGRQSVGIRSLAIIPPVSLIAYFMGAVRRDGEPGGDREGLADRLAASVVSRESLASALVKVHAFAPAWDAVVGAMLRAVAERTQYVNAGALFEQTVAANRSPERLLGLGQVALWHPADRHPALARRLEALGVALDEVATAALETAPRLPAIQLVRDSEALEQSLSQAEHRLMAETGAGQLLSRGHAA